MAFTTRNRYEICGGVREWLFDAFHNRFQLNSLNQEKGYFLFSLDTELAWGYFDCFNPRLFSANGQRERRAIDRLLEIFDDFKIVATWAIVGHLFYERYETRVSYPAANRWSNFPIFEELYKTSSPLLYGVDIIDTLLKRGSRHELAFHGYTHRVFSEHSMSEEEAAAEIQAWLSVAGQRNIIPRAVVFPRNKVGHLGLFNEYGFICFRGEELMPKLFSMPLVGRVFRRYYYYLSAFYTPLIYEPKVDPSGLVNLSSSRWFFGFNRKLDRVLDTLNLTTIRIRKIAEGVHRAASEKKTIHIWAHPCEFRTEKDFEKLRYLLRHVAEEVSAGRLQSVGMAELARKALEKTAVVKLTMGSNPPARAGKGPAKILRMPPKRIV